MNDWLKISLLLSIFGFLKELRPSEPYLYDYLIDPRWRNISDEQVQQQVYPIGSYSYLAQLFIVFLITDLCRYKALIVLLGLAGIAVWAMLIWTTTLVDLQIVEVLYGTFMATEVAYYTYIYAKVDTEFYPQVSSHTRAAILAGRCVSGLLAQMLISLNWMDFKQLNYITFAAMIAATFWCLFLPPVKRSIYFNQQDIIKQPLLPRVSTAFTLMKSHVVDSFSNGYVLKWSFWWALSTCGFIQVQNYMQPLWTVIAKEEHVVDDKKYNGAVEAILTVLGFLGSLLAGVLKIEWAIKGELLLTCCSILQGFALLWASYTEHIVICYICYVLFGAMYHTMVTVASSEIAKQIKEDSYGLVFGINTFLALAAQSLMTVIVVSKGLGFGWNLEPRMQYFVYGAFHVCIATVFIIIGLTNWLTTKGSRNYV